MTVGQCIQKVRKEKGLSQQELGKKLGVTGSMIGQYESDLRKPKINTVNKIATVLGVNPIFLTKDDPHYPLVVDVSIDDLLAYRNQLLEQHNSETEYELLIKIGFSKLNAEGQKKAINYIEDLMKVADYRK